MVFNLQRDKHTRAGLNRWYKIECALAHLDLNGQELLCELHWITNELNGKRTYFIEEIAKQSMFNYLSIYLWVSNVNGIKG